MPEGPEVEVVLRQLAPLLEGATVVESRSSHSRFVMPAAPFSVRRAHRHGKWIVIALQDGRAMLVNLGMSGRFVIGMERPRHVRWEVLVAPADGSRRRALRYVDPRGFGRLAILEGDAARDALRPDALSVGSRALGLGPDLMGSFMTSETTMARLPRWRRALDTSVGIKAALMDQSRLAGLGNIYAAEACWIGRVHPERPARAVREDELTRMVEGVPAMLRSAVAAGGTSFGDANSYRDARGAEGANSANLRVYGREGLACKCGATVARIASKRSTYFCPKCQAR